jgi:hypothetical protein
MEGLPTWLSQPRGSASTVFRLQIPYYHLLESVTVKSTHERLQSGAGRPPPGPTGQQTLHTTSLCQVHSRGDIYFGGIPNYFVIS